MPSEHEATIRYIQKKIKEIENAGKVENAMRNVGNINSPNNAFVFDTNDGNFVRNVATLSLIPANKRINIGAKHGNSTWIPYDVRTIRKIINRGSARVPHLSGMNFPSNVKNRVNAMMPPSVTASPMMNINNEYNQDAEYNNFYHTVMHGQPLSYPSLEYESNDE